LSIKNMMKNHKVARSFGDAAIWDTVRKLSYKAERFDKAVVSVNTFFPSSKLCSCCGCKKHLLNLNDRVWTCKDCWIVHDRDENAGRNIRNEWLRMINSQKCGWEQPTQTPFWEGVRRVWKDTQSSVMKESNGYDLSEATT
jgi:putative transposase